LKAISYQLEIMMVTILLDVIQNRTIIKWHMV